MTRKLIYLLVVLLSVKVEAAEPAAAQPTPDEAAVRQAVVAYVEAFGKHDAQALAELWSPEAVYTNRLTGEEVVGRAAIAEQFAAIFKAQPDLKLDATSESVQLLSPNAAVEHGTAKLIASKGEPEIVKYTAIYIKRDGRWLLDRVTDNDDDEAPSHYEQLKVLEWMVGTWVDDDDNATITTECNWAKNRNFLTRSYSITVGDRIDLSGMQIIGWDASTKSIRSWTFDSDGGFAEAAWTFKKDRWLIRNTGILADGRKASAVNVMKPVDADSFTWQTIERTAGGELLPNVNEVQIVRK
ncbi:MAG: SgcJ/EcaC family oxidoreductase [Planctomycetia bacterium]|nr:SgcJ/EcaC family oxidoreductase [Planctomycetia bacterium]